jgi:hypothetical protein
MEALTSADLLDVWEQGASAGGSERALLLLGYARPDLPAARLGEMPISGRDADLLRLREATFGRQMVAVASCPSCHEALELDLDAAAIRPDVDAASAPRAVTVTVDGREFAVRMPTTDDLIGARSDAATSGLDRSAIRRALVVRLLDGDGAGLSSELETAVAKAIAEDEVELGFGVSCPACGHGWDTTIDAASWLWEEVAVSAQRLAADVAGLAAAYGWRESEVLRLTPWRRQLYLGLAAE